MIILPLFIFVYRHEALVGGVISFSRIQRA
jgi:hypothetical protein